MSATKATGLVRWLGFAEELVSSCSRICFSWGGGTKVTRPLSKEGSCDVDRAIVSSCGTRQYTLGRACAPGTYSTCVYEATQWRYQVIVKRQRLRGQRRAVLDSETRVMLWSVDQLSESALRSDTVPWDLRSTVPLRDGTHFSTWGFIIAVLSTRWIADNIISFSVLLNKSENE